MQSPVVERGDPRHYRNILKGMKIVADAVFCVGCPVSTPLDIPGASIGVDLGCSGKEQSDPSPPIRRAALPLRQENGGFKDFTCYIPGIERAR